ncbi:MAG TPA: tetratricopeptide repeat protein [Thermoanaerobaculia bacterium]
MIEADRILEPVAPDAQPIRGLREYTNAASLRDALRATTDAIEQSLRLLLRSDRGASEHDRMRAMSTQDLSFDELIDRLRARDRVSIQLAGTLHELRRRIETGGADWAPGPADADRALEVVARLRREVQTIEDAPVREVAHHAVVEQTNARPRETSEVPASRARSRLPALVAIGAALLAVTIALVVALRGDPMKDGIEAFRAEDLTEAVAHFREAIEDDENDATARLYLGRVYRRLDRDVEAGEQLAAAARVAPRDADVRRELGYFFLDRRTYEPAVRQFEQAVELEPGEEANWIGLVRAMRLAGDGRAESTLARAPAAARALLTREDRASAAEADTLE